ncbi:MAG: hypothetical protein CMJ78_14390 [Planctomycetaceae bacterium]|nr:hypothetical protein [Planctomycetaceae bacterium]
MAAEWDAIVIGAGHNGLVCAGYLATAGMRVLVLERSHRVGGASITEELYPGCHFSTFAYSALGPGPKICRDLEVPADAFDIVRPNPSMFFPFPDGEHILLWSDPEKTAQGLQRFGNSEVHGYHAYCEFMSKAKQIAKDMFYEAPLTTDEYQARYRGSELEPVFDALMTRSHWSLLEDYFQNDYVRAAFGRADDVGYPRAVGSLLAEAIESANDGAGINGIAGIPRGGMGSITAALAEAARRLGVEIQTEMAVGEIIIEGGQATGVVLQDGSKLTAKLVISNADPKRTFLKLCPRDQVDAEFLSQIEQLKTRAGNMKFHAVLSGVPNFTAMPDEHRGQAVAIAGVRISPSLEYFDRAWEDCLSGIPSREPVMSLQLPTAYFPELAPPGKHIFGAWIRYGPRTLQEGTWDDWRPRVEESILSILESYAPGFRELVEWKRLYTPADIESETGITDATIRHLDMTIDQMLHRRPLASWASYATPINSLWLCGSGTHPCGSVTGAPGHNAAHAILKSETGPL